MTLTTVTVVGLSSAFIGNTVQAEATSDLKSKQSEVYSERSSIKANLSDAEAKIANVMIDLKERNKKIEQVDKALTANQNKMDETKAELKDTKAEVNKLEDEIKTLEDEIEARYEILKERVVSYQKSGGNIGYMDVIFGSKSFSEFINRVSAVNKITNSDEKLMQEQEKAKKEVEGKQDKVENKLMDLNDMKVDLEGMKETILVQKEQNVKAKENLKTRKQDLEAVKEDLQIKDSSLAAIEAEVNKNITQKDIEHEREIAATQAAEAGQGETSSSNDSNSRELATLISEKTTIKSSSKSTNSVEKKEEVRTTVAPAPGGGISTAMTAGNKYIGNSVYVWGGGRNAYDIQNGRFDCSGFLSWAYSQGGISVPASTAQLQNLGQKVSYSNIQPGDLVFFDTYKINGHAGIYLGGGKFIGSQSSTGVAIADMTTDYWASKFKGYIRRIR